MEKKYLLHSGWKFTLHGNSSSTGQDLIKQEEWYKATVPGTIHTDLFNNELIAEPFYADNELQIQWIGEADWLYKTAFDLPHEFDKGKPVYLVFEGLDTVCEIFINSVSVGSADNMFCKHKFDISSHLKTKANTLEVLFLSAVRYACGKEKKSGRLPVALRSERVYIRKAQYSFGWDWGPCYITSGIWRSVYLSQQTDISIENIFFETVQASAEEAIVKVKAELSRKPDKGYRVKVKLDGEGQSFEKELSAFDGTTGKIKLNIAHPRLWWPNNYGEPFLYTLSVQLVNADNEVVEEKIRRVGIRTIRLKLTENKKPAFQFVINDIPIFAMGANWIPSDSFLTRVNESEYRSYLKLAKNANMNIIRVWGGGIYENTIFYDICDELGLMVWQDFMFACASYPETEEFLKNIKHEVEENIQCLQYHASIAIWCGNNENEWIWYQEQKRPVAEMPGYGIFHEIIPKIAKKIDPGRPYWPSTPFGNDDDPNSVLSGNRHQWDLWSRWVDYKKVKDDESLFVTEFGFQGPANYETLKKVIPKKERTPQSRIFEFHNKQIEGPERLYKFLVSHLPVQSDIKDFIYLTQLNQGFALKECIEHWRMRFPETNGSVIWQLNDCWPVTSWSLIDSEQRPKLAYYFVKDVFKPRIVVFRRKGNKIEVVLLNNSRSNFSGIIHLQYIHLPKGKIEDVKSHDVNMLPVSKQVMTELDSSFALEQGSLILLATLYDSEKKLLHRNYYAAQEWKYLKLPKAAVRTTEDYSNHVVVSSDKPAFFVILQEPNLIFNSNGFIVMPDEERMVRVKEKTPGHKEKDISYRCLNEYLS